MHTKLTYRTQKLVLADKLGQAARRSLDAPSGSRRRYRRRHAALAASIAALILGALPSLASAQSLNSVAIATGSSSSWLVLDVSGAATYPGAPVVQWYANGGSNQRWNFVDLGNNQERIVNQNSSMCLTTDGVAGDQVFQWPCNNSDPHQVWSGALTQYWGGFHGLMNPASGLYLDVSGDNRWAGGQLITWWWNGSSGDVFSYQQF